MKIIKILQFTIAQSQGGRTQYILNNWNAIDKSRFQFDFATFSPYLDFEDELTSQGCKVFHLSCYARDNKEQFVKEIDQILDEGYDVLHLHTSYWEDYVVEERAKKKNIKKVIIHSHSTGISKALTEDELEKGRKHHYQIREQIVESIATNFCACSDEAAQWLFGDKIPKDKIDILFNGIDINRFKFDKTVRNKMRFQYGISDETIVIGNVGRLVYTKNQEFLLDVIKRIDCEKFKLVLVGGGENRERLQEYANTLGIERQVIFTGYSKNVSDFLQMMDIFAFPSRYEAFGLSLVEAECSGLTCIVSENVSESSCVSDKLTRLPLIVDDWVERITEILTEKGYLSREDMDYKSLMQFDIKTQVKVLEKIYMGE